MRVLFDHGTRAPLRNVLDQHVVATAYEMGRSALDNGALLKVAEESFDVFVTTDQNLRYQQNLAGRRPAILVLPTTSWPRLRAAQHRIAHAIDAMRAGDFVELSLS
jgi:hypothetical protein